MEDMIGQADKTSVREKHPRRPRRPRPRPTAPHAGGTSHAGWVYHVSIKIMLVTVACAMLLTTLCGVLILLAGSEFGLLTMNRVDFRHSLYEQVAWRQLYTGYHYYTYLYDLYELNDQSITDFSRTMAANAPADLYLRVTYPEEDLVLFDNIPADAAVDWYTSDVEDIHYYPDQTSMLTDTPIIREYEVTLMVPEVKTAGSLYATIYTIAETLHSVRWAILLVTVLAAMLVIGLFALVMLVAGRQPDGTVRCNTVDQFPYDLFLLLYAALGFLEWGIIYELSFSNFESGIIALCAVFSMIDMPLIVLLFMSTATRCKCGTVLKNTVIWRLILLVVHVLTWIWRVPICGLALLIARLVRAIPLIWQGLIIMVTLSVTTLLLTLFIADELFIVWLIPNLVLFPLGIYLLISLRRLQQGARRLAQGDLNFRVDEKPLLGALRRHAEDLNNIRMGINRAVEERMRSERFRTELITNVSHDIKTPLTSIINYIDLLDRELAECEVSETTVQYLEVIERQSLRLKKLIEDLTEASKASTGALSVNLAPCQVSVLLSQALAEYQEKLDAAQLEAVVRLPEEEPIISADGRLIWRVFDNLLSNAAKYSLRGTRLYIDVDTVLTEGRDSGNRPYLRILFRNISGQPLNISPEELMERFVRGDASRHTEGSGLGLSIARSLVELHHGALELDIDGDLFKATVLLPM
ncbi:MAG: sensor histidine kinase [Clostridia bacterium]|nr:sensor histidine kinase [Clostridia bacterium]